MILQEFRLLLRVSDTVADKVVVLSCVSRKFIESNQIIEYYEEIIEIGPGGLIVHVATGIGPAKS